MKAMGRSPVPSIDRRQWLTDRAALGFSAVGRLGAGTTVAQAESNLSWARMTTRYLSTYNGMLRRAPSRVALAELPSSTW